MTALPGCPGVAVSQKRRDEEHRQPPRDSLIALSPILEHNVVCVLMLVQRPIMTCVVSIITSSTVLCIAVYVPCLSSVSLCTGRRQATGRLFHLTPHNTPIIIIIVIYYTQYCVSTAYLWQLLPLHTIILCTTCSQMHATGGGNSSAHDSDYKNNYYSTTSKKFEHDY